MKIDTRYTETGDSIVTIALGTDTEHLTHEQLARIAANQHLLRWHDHDVGVVYATPAVLRSPVPDDYTVSVIDGVATIVLPVVRC